MQTSFFNPFKQTLKNFLFATLQKLSKNVAKDHLSLWIRAAKPKNVVSAKSNFKLTIFLKNLQFTLNEGLST